MHQMRAAAVSGLVALWLGMGWGVASAGAGATGADPLPVITVTEDDTVIDRSCVIRVDPAAAIADTNGDGVIHITASNVSIQFEPGSELRGAPAGTDPDKCVGIGIHVRAATGVTISDARIQGFKVGIRAERTPGLTIERVHFDNLYRQRLYSTPQAEDQRDWLWPHANDHDEWALNNGGAVFIKDSNGVTVRSVLVRTGQNGILLSRVNNSKVYDNDCSFLSGWGLAMWRSCDNIVSRNAFDFCIRGYSHGVYNRGQDSAGILAFEQCSRNLFIENSATHGGDGFFGFAGKEALGEAPPPEANWDYTRRGCNDNTFIGNDFSYAAAHGLELTFSFGNRVHDNVLVGNGICGVWGGYCQDMVIDKCTIEDNGAPGSNEGGGINIEHGFRNSVFQSAFARNSVGVSLWSDDDGALLRTPWAKANHKGSDSSSVSQCRFNGDKTAIRLRQTTDTITTKDEFIGVQTEVDADARSNHGPSDMIDQIARMVLDDPAPKRAQALGSTRPVGARAALRGRDKIIMDEWGPWDHTSPMIKIISRAPGAHTYGIWNMTDAGASLEDAGGLRLQTFPPDAKGEPARVVVSNISGGVESYSLSIGGARLRKTFAETFFSPRWKVRFFPLTEGRDPRQDATDFASAESPTGAVEFDADTLNFTFGQGGPSDLPGMPKGVRMMKLPRDRFGTRAECTIRLPSGLYRVTTLSDDGVRVRVRQTSDAVTGALDQPKRFVETIAINNWTHHGPTTDTGEFRILPVRGEVTIIVEHFELDGYAVLKLDVQQPVVNLGDPLAAPDPQAAISGSDSLPPARTPDKPDAPP